MAALSTTQQQRIPEKSLPKNVEAEASVLGSLIIDPEAIKLIASFLKPQDFYRDAHRSIYTVLLDCYKRETTADFVILCDELERHGELENVGGASYIISLVNSVPTSSNVEFYAHIVERSAMLRNLIDAAGKIAVMGYEEEADPQEALSASMKLLQDIADKVVTGNLTRASSHIETFMSNLDFMYGQEVRVVGVPLGYKVLDHMIPGLCKGEVAIVAARPGIGKSIMLLNIALHVASSFHHQTGARYRVAMFSLEMRKEELVNRLIAQKARVDSKRLRVGDVYSDEWEALIVATDAIEELELYFDDTGTLNCLDIKTRVQQLEQQVGKVDLIVIDYLQLLQPLEKRNGENRVAVIGEISRSLKTMLARDLDIPVLCAAQLNRDAEKRASKRPQLSDLREGGIELDADIILMMHREDVYDPETERKNIVDVVVAKQRNGPLGDVELYADNAHVRFLDIDKFIDEKSGY